LSLFSGLDEKDLPVAVTAFGLFHERGSVIIDVSRTSIWPSRSTMRASAARCKHRIDSWRCR
jgi:hypothetical protein